MTPEEIWKLRHDLGMTQEQFGEMLHAKRRTVQNWEAGTRNMAAPTQELLRRILDSQRAATQ